MGVVIDICIKYLGGRGLIYRPLIIDMIPVNLIQGKPPTHADPWE
jgi:hypothetical protein